MKRPLWTVGIGFGLGSLTATLFDLRLCVVCGAVCGILAIFAVCLPVSRHTAAPAALFATAAAFCLFTVHYCRTALPAENFQNSTVYVTAVVVEADNARLVGEITDGDLPIGTRLLVYAEGSDAEVGSILTGSCYVRGCEDGFTRLCTSDPLTVLAGEGIRWQLSLWRRQLGQVYSQLDEETGGVLMAMCLGDDRSLTADIAAAFRRAGTAHLLCVSGLHVSIIAAAVLTLLRRIRRPRFVRPLLAMLAVLLYMGLTGFHYSALRAGIMQLLFLLGGMLGREADGRNSLGGALLFILLFDPAAVYDVGLWMSVFATAGLFILYPALKPYVQARVQKLPVTKKAAKRLVTRLADALLISVCAVVAITPVQLLVFGQFTWIAPLSNLPAVPLATPLVIIGCLAALTGLCPPLSFLNSALLFVAKLLARGLIGISRLSARIPYATLSVESPYLVWWILGSLLLLCVGWRLFRKAGIKAALLTSAITLVCGVGIAALSMQGVTSLKALPIGDGTAVLITSGDRHALVLTGDTVKIPRAAARQLTDEGVYTLDWLILPQEQENNTAISALTDSAIPIGRVAVTAMSESLPDGIAFTLWDEELTLWDSLRVQRLESGWMRLWIGDTCCLYCPPDGDAALLDADWRAAHLLLFDRTPPLHNTALFAQQGIVCCDATRISYVTKALPWGVYPLRFTADGTVTVYTRGRGDLYSDQKED